MWLLSKDTVTKLAQKFSEQMKSDSFFRYLYQFLNQMNLQRGAHLQTTLLGINVFVMSLVINTAKMGNAITEILSVYYLCVVYCNSGDPHLHHIKAISSNIL